MIFTTTKTITTTINNKNKHAIEKQVCHTYYLFMLYLIMLSANLTLLRRRMDDSKKKKIEMMCKRRHGII
jgi:uncharacterized membrane protein YhaH (DUF805 family)